MAIERIPLHSIKGRSYCTDPQLIRRHHRHIFHTDNFKWSRAGKIPEGYMFVDFITNIVSQTRTTEAFDYNLYSDLTPQISKSQVSLERIVTL